MALWNDSLVWRFKWWRPRKYQVYASKLPAATDKIAAGRPADPQHVHNLEGDLVLYREQSLMLRS